MKTHTIKTPTAELLIVEMPEKIDRCWVLVHSNHIWINNRETGDIHRVKGSYTLLGKPDEVREDEKWDVYKPYIGSIEKETAKESLLSLIESEIYWDMNPYESKVDSLVSNNSANGCALYRKAFHEFCETEKKTFDRKRTLIFKKI